MIHHVSGSRSLRVLGRASYAAMLRAAVRASRRAGQSPGPLVAKAQPGEIQEMATTAVAFACSTASSRMRRAAPTTIWSRTACWAGFAVIAWPVRWGETGVMTFMVSHDSDVYEKDLGPDTAQAAAAINVFNADKSWDKADMTPWFIRPC